MSIYTKDQRYTIYCIMLKEAECETELYPGLGFCLMFQNLTCECDMYKEDGGEKNFPEIWERKPKKAGDYFFPTTKKGWEKRKQLLRECIEETDDF